MNHSQTGHRSRTPPCTAKTGANLIVIEAEGMTIIHGMDVLLKMCKSNPFPQLTKTDIIKVTEKNSICYYRSVCQSMYEFTAIVVVWLKCGLHTNHPKIEL